MFFDVFSYVLGELMLKAKAFQGWKLLTDGEVAKISKIRMTENLKHYEPRCFFCQAARESKKAEFWHKSAQSLEQARRPVKQCAVENL